MSGGHAWRQPWSTIFNPCQIFNTCLSQKVAASRATKYIYIYIYICYIDIVIWDQLLSWVVGIVISCYGIHLVFYGLIVWAYQTVLAVLLLAKMFFIKIAGYFVTFLIHAGVYIKSLKNALHFACVSCPSPSRGIEPVSVARSVARTRKRATPHQLHSYSALVTAPVLYSSVSRASLVSDPIRPSLSELKQQR